MLSGQFFAEAVRHVSRFRLCSIQHTECDDSSVSDLASLVRFTDFFWKHEENSVDVLIIDEAHRIRAKSNSQGDRRPTTPDFAAGGDRFARRE